VGTSYDAVCFHGIMFGSEDCDGGWPASTRAAFDAVGADDFADWLAAYLGVAPWYTKDGKQREYADFQADVERRCFAVFGIGGFRHTWLGHIDYPTWAVIPEDASARTNYRGEPVPEFDPGNVERWREACARLAAVLPGAGPFGFYFGPHVG
jgi:hypothetical protein